MDEDPQQLTLLIQNLTTNSIDLNLLLASIAMLSLLFCSAMISGSEVAYFSLDASKWKEEEDKTSVTQIKKITSETQSFVSNNIDIKQLYQCSHYYTLYLHDR